MFFYVALFLLNFDIKSRIIFKNNYSICLTKASKLAHIYTSYHIYIYTNFFPIRSIMVWTKEKDELLYREVTLLEPYKFKARSRDRGSAWKDISEALNSGSTDELYFKADALAVRRVRIKRIAIAKCDPFFNYRDANVANSTKFAIPNFGCNISFLLFFFRVVTFSVLSRHFLRITHSRNTLISYFQ